MAARLLWSIGVVLVALGLAAHLFGWGALLRIPMTAIEIVRANPWTYGGTVKLSPLVRPSWRAEDGAGAEFRPRRQPR